MPQGLLFNVGENRSQGTWKPPESLPELGRYKRIYLDSETTGLDFFGSDRPVGIAIALEETKEKYYLPWGHLGGGNLDEGLVKRWAKTELRDKHIVSANAKFENHMLLKWGIDLEAQGCQLHEIQHPAALLDEKRRKYNINDLALHYLGDQKAELPQDVRIHEMSAGEVGPYAEQDADLVRRLDQAFRKPIKDQGLQDVLDLEDSLLFAVCEMERNGALIDVERLQAWKVDTQRRYEETVMEVYRRTGLRVNPNAPDDLKKLLKHLNISFRYTEKGSASFTAEFLAGLKHPVIDLVLYARKLADVRSKYIIKYLKYLNGKNILRYQLHQLRTNQYGTVTGRFSSANINIQQVLKPKNNLKYLPEFMIRELFLPEPGTIFVTADANQIEFRIFVHYSRATRLIQAYNENPNTDFHVEVANLCEIERDPAKTINFGKVYGMGRDKFARELGITRREADPIVDRYDEMFPEARRLLNQAMAVAERRGYVRTHLGRRRRYTREEKTHSALNAVIQGTAAEIMKKKILEIYRNRKLLGFKMRWTVHDELDGDLENIGKKHLLKELLNQQAYRFRVPITWDVSTGKNWRESSS
ncbi:hypothetical protein LCGC14_1009250 [marine sediment metagenome]|uniref:DNA-directed DNA polymerase family A palm domain-containing protein n=1 Tax=marine sediment metagenome TaxID=412755 RepID=A0A0F9QJ13_9ZZZZ